MILWLLCFLRPGMASVFVRDSRRALFGPSRFVLLMTIELYRHC